MNKIQKNFYLYKNKTKSDYEILLNGSKAPTSSFIITPDYDKNLKIVGENIIISDEVVNNLSPDKIDSREFWTEATKLFPYFSVCGGKPEKEDINMVNENTLKMAHKLNVITPVLIALRDNPNAKLLEIGSGYGGFYRYITRFMCDKNYYGIDVNPLFVHPRLFQTTGSTIPNKIPNDLSIVYSMNVFQHLSKKQRTAYYKRIYKKLSNSGIFVFGMFLQTDENKNWPVWNYKDKNGRPYVQFFRQFTPVDTKTELYNELFEIGFKIVDITPSDVKTHYRTFCVQKK